MDKTSLWQFLSHPTASISGRRCFFNSLDEMRENGGSDPGHCFIQSHLVASYRDIVSDVRAGAGITCPT